MPPVNGYEFKNAPFQDVKYLIEQTELLYQEQIVPRGGPDRYQAAVDRIVDHRLWRPSMPLIAHNLYAVLKELDIFYVPKQMSPGPCLVFPHWDTTGESVRGKIRPIGWDLILNDTLAKYGLIGNGFEFKGPMWMGNSDRVIEMMMRLRYVVLVEGPFDVLACRLLCPGVPVLSSGTKSLNEMHLHYLKVLGVKKLMFLFDNEGGKKEGDMGAGEVAATGTKKAATALGLNSEILICPSKNDPSACLQVYDAAFRLKSMLNGFFPA